MAPSSKAVYVNVEDCRYGWRSITTRCKAGLECQNSSVTSSDSKQRSEEKRKMASKKGSGADIQVQTQVIEYTDYTGRRVREQITKRKSTCGSESTESESSKVYIDGESSSKKAKGAKEKSRGPMTKKDKQNFRSECLQRHNELRKKHEVHKLKRNVKLEKDAQKWAEELVKIRRLKESSNRHYGENLAYECSSEGNCTGAEICDKWYGEVKNYDFCRPGYYPDTTHFTQLVWAGTKQIGIGVADNGKGGVFAVANYKPPGNDVDKYEANVKKSK